MDDGVYDLLSRGRAAAKVGDLEEARFYLEWVLRQVSSVSPERLEALYWLSHISDDPAKKRDLLTDILVVEPSNARARRQLAILDGKIDPQKSFDPDQIPAQESPAEIRLNADEMESFTCPTCGGRLTYTPDGTALTCEFCENRQALGNANPTDSSDRIREEEFVVGLATAGGHHSPVSTQVVICQSCGANFLEPPVTLTLTCPYCDAVYVVRHEEDRQILPPSGLIPFEVSDREALRAIQTWLTANHIRPEHTIPLPQGVYLPVWSFDMGGQIDWKGSREDGKIPKPVEGSNPIISHDVLIPGSPRLKDLFSRQLKEYHLDRLVPYDPRYLVNWLAETYQVSLAQASLDAREQVYRKSQVEIISLYCEGLEGLRFSTAGLFVETYKLLLLPVWIGHYLEDGSRHELLINGQTGAVEGNNPNPGLQSWFARFFEDE